MDHNLPETERYGMGNFIYRARRPFHPERLYPLLEENLPGVIRSTGFFWLATRPGYTGFWSRTDGVSIYGLAGQWWSAIPRDTMSHDAQARIHPRQHWLEGIGDARQELVLIGRGLDEAVLRKRFDDCLLTDEEMALGAKIWQWYSDPFPAWY
ncbi:GTP-binding protein [Sodalis sp. RH16]|uniref:GTP-binding protein n=1 Tax=Sodalis sp. RH16 TaxID=3394331 RepID=UPI0039B44A39